MTLTEAEKTQIAAMQTEDVIELEDYTRSNYQYKVERLTTKEYRVSKFAVMCLNTEFFSSPADVVDYIERQHVY